MERKKETKKILEKEIRLIGIGSTCHAVGCTHFAIVMVNYLAGYQRRKAALLEWNRSDDFEKLEIVCIGKSRERKPFRVFEADFYKAAGSAELAWSGIGQYNDLICPYAMLRLMGAIAGGGKLRLHRGRAAAQEQHQCNQ